jgi:hypothetical protein
MNERFGLVPDREETLGEFLASRARRASDVRLAGNAIAAVLAAIAIGVWRGPAWDIRLSIAVCLLAFGIWGIADRDIVQKGAAPRRVLLALKATRVIAAVVGFAAGAFLMMALLGRALGRIIS